MKKFLLIPLIFFLTFSSAYGETNLFSFTTKPQIVLPSLLSKEITVQSQNSAGLPEALTETFDLNFISSSPTGLFLGSTGKPATKTMGKGTANRTFYYKDSSLGHFIITVIATGRESKKIFVATQDVIISEQSEKEEMRSTAKPASKEITNDNKTEKPPTVSANATGTVLVFTAPERKGFINTILAWPVKIFNFVKRLFVEE